MSCGSGVWALWDLVLVRRPQYVQTGRRYTPSHALRVAYRRFLGKCTMATCTDNTGRVFTELNDDVSAGKTMRWTSWEGEDESEEGENWEGVTNGKGRLRLTGKYRIIKVWRSEHLLVEIMWCFLFIVTKVIFCCGNTASVSHHRHWKKNYRIFKVEVGFQMKVDLLSRQLGISKGDYTVLLKKCGAHS